jgi:inner membrane protease ATP23
MVYSARCSVINEVTSGGGKPPEVNSAVPPVKSESGRNEITDPENWGYDLYPERRGEKYKSSWTKVIFGGEGRGTFDKARCEKNVYNCVKNSK